MKNKRSFAQHVFMLMFAFTVLCAATLPRVAAAEEAAKNALWQNVPVINSDALKATLENAKGKVIVLNFFASWCPPCAREMPDFVALYREYQNDPTMAENVVFLGVSVDIKRPPLLAMKERYNINFPIAMADDDIPELWGIRGIPRTLILSPEQTWRFDEVGAMEKSTLARVIGEIWAERK